MGPRLSLKKLYFIRDMIESRSLTTTQIAEEAECSKVTITNIRRNLRQFGSHQKSPFAKCWSKKTARQHAKEQNAHLRELYLHNLSDFQSYHLIYVDESGCDKRAGFRRTGWSPLDITVPSGAAISDTTYAQDGIILSRVFCGVTDNTAFEDFLSQLLHHCGRWPELKSVVVMDNASFHHSERILQMCADTGVKVDECDYPMCDLSFELKYRVRNIRAVY
ncbi:hypothetical protein N7495_009353 [Penicillium taxi]|uniref:uncharacterized protein n=1 Tax=Penicillium taxi TaxID=168475 RepID=UPI002544D7A5|nr:uncharacterized protein N7495_009353 [Penicillium taxi]KAJ5884843.1 hypothetical protein N7495_009353 [Penicillium taxi]